MQKAILGICEEGAYVNMSKVLSGNALRSSASTTAKLQQQLRDQVAAHPRTPQ